MRYLKLNFKNAGFFEIHSKTNDWVLDLKGKRKRKDVFKDIKQDNVISVNQVSNMLHVLMGERPSATYRQTMIKPLSDIRELSNNALIQIDTPQFYNKLKECFCFPSETMTTRKAVGDSWVKKRDHIYWKRIENLLTDNEDNSLYTELIDVLSNMLHCDVLKIEAILIPELIKKSVNTSEYITFLDKLKKHGKGPVIMFLSGRYGEGNRHDFVSNERTQLTVNFSIENISKIDGSILIPLEEEYIDKIKNNKGCATLLDGGFVSIVGLYEDYELGQEYSNYININDLKLK